MFPGWCPLHCQGRYSWETAPMGRARRIAPSPSCLSVASPCPWRQARQMRSGAGMSWPTAAIPCGSRIPIAASRVSNPSPVKVETTTMPGGPARQVGHVRHPDAAARYASLQDARRRGIAGWLRPPSPPPAWRKAAAGGSTTARSTGPGVAGKWSRTAIRAPVRRSSRTDGALRLRRRGHLLEDAWRRHRGRPRSIAAFSGGNASASDCRWSLRAAWISPCPLSPARCRNRRRWSGSCAFASLAGTGLPDGTGRLLRNGRGAAAFIVPGGAARLAGTFPVGPT